MTKIFKIVEKFNFGGIFDHFWSFLPKADFSLKKIKLSGTIPKGAPNLMPNIRKKLMCHFLTAILLSNDQLCAIFEETASLTQCVFYNTVFSNILNQGSLGVSWGGQVPKPSRMSSGVWTKNLSILIVMTKPTRPPSPEETEDRRTGRRMDRKTGQTEPNLQEISSHGWGPIKHLPTFAKD